MAEIPFMVECWASKLNARAAERALKTDLVEAEFVRSYPVSDRGDGKRPQNTKQTAFRRAMAEAAIRKNVIATREIHSVDWVWLSRRDGDGPGPEHSESA
jgi:hypothetical protein